MLNKKEKAVFLAVSSFLDKKKSCLITLDQIQEKIDPKLKLNYQDIEKIIDELAFDGYIDSVVSVNSDKTYYCISFLKKGNGFWREQKQSKRSLVNKVAIAVITAVVSFAVTMILRAIF